MRTHLSRYEAAWEAINRLIRSGGSWSGYERNCFFQGVPGGRFVNLSAASGLDLVEDGRGLAVWDFDRDGDPDLLLKNRNGPQVRILRNDCEASGGRLAVRLEGTRSNRQAIGARVTVIAGALRRTKELRAGSGFLSQNAPVLFFGLGEARLAGELEVKWPSGRADTFRDLPAGAEYLVREGGGIVSRPFANAGGQPETAIAEDESCGTPREKARFRRLWLLDPVPLPGVRAHDTSGSPVDWKVFRGRAFLLNLWSPDCPRCLEELAGWDRARAEDADPLPVVALAARPDDGDTRLAEVAKSALVAVAAAAPEELLALGVLVEDLARWPRELPLPASLLIDGEGRVVRLYEGPVPWGDVTRDVARIPAGESARLRLALPFPGRYHASDVFRSEFQLGVSYLEAGLADRALDSFQRTLERRPGDLDALYNVGLIHLGAGRLAAARQAFEESLETHPDFADAQVNLGVVSAREGRFERARAHFVRALELRPDHVEALMNLGSVEVELGHPEQAMRLFDRALVLEPGMASLQKRRGGLLRRLGDLASARKAYEAAVEAAPRDAEAWSNLAVIRAESGDLEAARAACENALEIDPRYASAHNNSGLILQAMGRHADAVAAFRRAIVLEPGSTPPYLNLARAHLRRGEEKEARRVLSDLLEVSPGNRWALELLEQLGERDGD